MNRSPRRPGPLTLTFVIALGLFCADLETASAQTDPINTQRFRPHATHDGVLTIEGANARHPSNPWGVGFWLNYGHNPLLIANDDEVITRVVGGQLGFNTTLSYAFAYWFELGLDIPFGLSFGDDTDSSTACAPDPCPTPGSEFALGDVRLVPKFTILDDRFDGFGLAVVPELRVPTHTGDFYGGARMVEFAPRVLLDHRFGGSGFRLASALGATIREETQYANVTAGHELDLGVALAWRFDKGFSPFELALDTHAAIGLVETDPEEVSLEILGAANFYVGNSWRFTLGAGAGVVEGYGTPTFRVLGGIRWTPSPDDPDDDGIGDEDDLDEYRDPDKDDDGKVDDKYDQDGDGEIDEQYDEDGDGEIDDDQARKEQMEDYRNPDKDGDGRVDDKYDKDGDGKVDEEFDEDGDGKLDDDVAAKEAVADGRDLCPDLPEDFDGVEDDDGCPEGDEDGDGVLDLYDRCEDEAEVINGFEDDDGCPDEGPAQVVVEGDKIKVLATIRFKTGSDELQEDSKPILDQLVRTLRARKDIRRVRVEGHTDSTGSRDLNMRLSQQRANSVKRYMTEHGIKSRRLTAVGYGPDQPIADNDTEEGRAANRRVEFVILQR